MKNDTISEIASKLNIGKSTVSRAIRHCGGVDYKTRQNVLNEVGIRRFESENACDIYTICPNVPQYFWDQVFQGLLSEALPNHLTIKNNVYTTLTNEETILHYLDEAEFLNARVIIIAAHITPKIHDKLATLNDGRFILFLSEYHELVNSYFVGSDMYLDGYQMGKQYLTYYGDRDLIVLTSSGNENATKRLNGFLKSIEEHTPDSLLNIQRIEVDNRLFADIKLLPSKLAPLLQNTVNSRNLSCVYSPFGASQLPLAITKAKVQGKVVCMCHDYIWEKQESCIGIVCNQNTFAQGATAMQMAKEYLRTHCYPEQIYTTIPSMVNKL